MKESHAKRNLLFLAGPIAYQQIQRQGLAPDHIGAVFGASGAAKWLAISGLDKAIFQHWLSSPGHPIDLVGASIGAWKLAAAAQPSPAVAMQRLADAYIAQSYDKGAGREDVAAQARRILSCYVDGPSVRHILEHPRFRLHIGTIRAKGLLSAEDSLRGMLAMSQVFLLNMVGRNRLRGMMERVVFSDSRSMDSLHVKDGFDSRQVALTEANFKDAVMASGSIPLVMPGVTDIPGAGAGIYRDGGFLDYHPIPGFFWKTEGIVLYPHFYPHLVPGWFDKLFANRKAVASQLSNVLLLAPSPHFVGKLPYRRIPDRGDFKCFQGNDAERMRFWRIAADESERLGEEFLETLEGGRIAERVELISS